MSYLRCDVLDNSQAHDLRHYQLRNFISTTDRDIVYFASECEIYALHTPSRRRERIATLSFKPQCLGAGHGWICVGGPEDGRCAFVEIGENQPFPSSTSLSTARNVEVDSLLPLDLDPQSRMLAPDFLDRHAEDRTPWRRPKVHYRDLGGLIVNAITVHKLSNSKDGMRDEVVAVVTCVVDFSRLL